MAIQAVDGEIARLRALPAEDTVPEDEVRLVDFENVAEELAELYDEALASEKGLLPYETLVRLPG
jgi:hypothetical protein